MNKFISTLLLAVSMLSSQAIAQSDNVPYVHDPVSPDFTTRTEWTCKIGFVSPVGVVVEHASIRSPDMKVRNQVKLFSVAGKSASVLQIESINSWLDDKWIEWISVTCNDPDKIEIMFTARQGDSEDSVDLVFVSDANGTILKKM